jgi:hypothetical protein
VRADAKTRTKPQLEAYFAAISRSTYLATRSDPTLHLTSENKVKADAL